MWPGNTPGPWGAEASVTKSLVENAISEPLRESLSDDIGVAIMTNADEVLLRDPSGLRRSHQAPTTLRWVVSAENIRDWSATVSQVVVSSYRSDGTLPTFSRIPRSTQAYLRGFRTLLENRKGFNNKTFKQLGRPLHSFERFNARKLNDTSVLAIAEIATHNHCVELSTNWAPERTALTISMDGRAIVSTSLIVGTLNSSTALFWLKQVCFNKRASETPKQTTILYTLVVRFRPCRCQ